ncbi:MAG: malto-oligosyltrehalose synthase [Rhodopirellula sp.]|nr:malto-oligosyltrehalose synthase [Rhodopirellula sp.]
MSERMDDWVNRLVEAIGSKILDRSAWPEATYRLELNKDNLKFGDAAEIAPYLEMLGVSHLYASPYLKSRSGSPHGYAVVDYARLNPELGTEDEYGAMCEALHSHGMSQLLDIVPNHMSADPENVWWRDVLENGPSSPYARYFDIDWRPVKDELRNKILLPLLGDQYGRVLESGDLRIVFQEGAFVLRYYDRELPLDPSTYRLLLVHQLDELKQTLSAEDEHLRELESILTALEYLPDRIETAPDRVEERRREKEVIKVRLHRLTGESPVIAQFVERNLAVFNGDPQHPQSFDLLDVLLDRQVYRLSHWKAASDEINYRRFFDINELAAVSMEEPEVFEASHEFVLDLIVRGEAGGLRIDHIDGLFDPMGYLWRLQWGYLRALGRAEFARIRQDLAVATSTPEHVGSAVAPPTFAAAPVPEAENADNASAEEVVPQWEDLHPHFLHAMWKQIGGLHPSRVFPSIAFASDGEAGNSGLEIHQTPASRLPLYVVVEKILSAEEPLPPEWPVAGTTGYDFLNTVNRLLVDPHGLPEITKAYGRFVADGMDFREIVYQSKQLILRAAMSSELQLLSYRLNRISERHRRSRDFTLNTLRSALREILAFFPIYRTYIGPGGVPERDRHFVHRAVAQAKRRNPATDAAAFDFIRDVLLLEQPPEMNDAGYRERELFVGRFQQVTSPVMAKGVEDTAFYRYIPLVSLNEVGGEPAEGALSVEEFHGENLARLGQRPWSLTCTSTHDTKRSEDVRARINVLSEIPRMWRDSVNRWGRFNRRYRRDVDGQPAPSRNDEYLFYQTLLGIWPLEPPDGPTHRQVIERMQAYMEKATHEAKRHTSWITPNADYDQAVREFVAAALEEGPRNRFVEDLRRVHEQVANWGLYTALSQVVLKLASPGVPDIYQGQEVWDFSLVDPDNRRPVPFNRHRDMLSQLQDDMADDASLVGLAQHLARNPRDPRTKLFVTWKLLEFRRRHAALFHAGSYLPLEAEGARMDYVCAFAWQLASAPGRPEQLAVVAVPRRLAQLTPADVGSIPPPPLGEGVWGDTQLNVSALAPWPMKNIFTGRQCRFDNGRLPLAAAFADFPVAVLTNLSESL